MSGKCSAICVVVLLQIWSAGADPSSGLLKRLDKGLRGRDMEGEFAERIYKALRFSPLDGERPTNWNQLSPALRADVWIRYEQEFLQYPESVRGFKVSLWEKYVFVPPGIDVPDQSWTSGGDLVMLQVGGPARSAARYALWRNRSGEYEIYPFSQSRIQEWFSKHGRQVPLPSGDLAPATPAGWESDGIPRDSAKRVSVFLIVSFVVGLFFVLIFRHFRRAR